VRFDPIEQHVVHARLPTRSLAFEPIDEYEEIVGLSNRALSPPQMAKTLRKSDAT
jgi:hypothetical protein